MRPSAKRQSASYYPVANDDETLIEQGQPTKEEITKEYLISQGVKANRIASWFTGKAKPEGLERNDSEYEYLLFKTAAGTGWDCPRAQVLVMFRDIKSEIFSTQTIGRILRVPIMHEEVSKVSVMVIFIPTSRAKL